ncbi:MAG: InlB B-repeat-containing protein, partial [Firmicutes bacterium]|nr:InlB B-repeat-containing protein [Bacillota bacterium]
TAASGGTQVTSSTVMTGNQTIYAQWNVPAATTYTVSYNANGGTGTTASSSHTYGVAKNLTSNGFSKTGYTFAGWATSATGPVVYSDGQSVINLTSTNGATVPLYAVWTAIPTTTYTITYNANGGSVSPANATVNVGSAVTTPTPTKSYTLTYSVNGGYALPSNTKIVSCTCNGWFTAASGGMKRANAGESYTPEQTETIYAQWTNPAMGALPTPSHPTPGYSFKGWFTAATGGTQVTSATAMMGNQTIYAQWNAPDSNKPSAGPLSTNERYGFVNSHRDFFGHSATEDGCKKVMTDSDFNKLADYAWKLYPGAAQSVVNAMQDDRNKNWGGSCYGMAVTSILDKQGKVDIKKNYGTNKVNLRDVSAPYLNAAARSAINYYQNSWELSKLWVGTGYNKNNGSTQWASGVKQMVDAAKEGNLPMLLCYYWYNANGGTSGHAIVVNGYSQNANGSHRLICYDNRYPTRDFIVTVSSNYSSVITELSEDAFLIYAQTDFDNYDRIDIDGPNNDFVLTAPSAAPAVQGATLSFPASSVVSITNSEGKTLRYNSATGTYTGDMQVISEYLLPNATVDGQATAATISLVVPESNSFTFTSSDSGVDASVISKDIYASGYSDQADEIAITKGKGIEITGKGSFDFTASLGINTTVMDMIKIEGRTDGDATLLFHSGGALVDGQSGNATLTVFSETTYASSHDINNTYGSAVIKDDGSGTPGKIEMLVDSNGDGTYDKNLLATSTKGIFGTNAKWYGAWWHYVLFFIGFGFIWMW